MAVRSRPSFAEKYVVKIITDLLTGAINLGEKYRKYYIDEYDTFDNYLFIGDSRYRGIEI